jgi:HSP20 family protein
MEAVKVNKEQSIAKTAPPVQVAPRANEFFAPMIPFGRWFGLSPFALMREFTEEMDRAFRGLGAEGFVSRMPEAWTPAVDVRQCNGDLVVTAELPGLKKEEIKVSLVDNALVVQGERKRDHEEDHEGYHRWERSYGQFYRSIPLPEGAKYDQVKAEMVDGVLKVTVPVPESKKVRQVPIEAKPAVAAAAAPATTKH